MIIANMKSSILQCRSDDNIECDSIYSRKLLSHDKGKKGWKEESVIVSVGSGGVN